MPSIQCGPLIFFSDFDSGNLLRAELVTSPTAESASFVGEDFSNSSVSSLKSQDFEFNLWTKPDCHGTRFENGNRTWFYFGIRGEKSAGSTVLKLNVLNLNKQVKLFAQGMQPVFKVVPDHPLWERVKDKLTINETGEHVCSISFRLKLPPNPEKSILYLSLTYPFSYGEVQNMLDKIDEDFLEYRSKLPIGNFCEKQSIYGTLRVRKSDEIYYCRECVAFSLDGKRIDLLTVSSHNGMSSEREPRLSHLFPCTDEPRPFIFPDKKVVFISARVHPGETQSTFVMNGFIKFIINAVDVRAIMLRRLFVFKLIPCLNPDGVSRGHYRSDPRGVNLNRVYLTPSPTLHPSIYAARKLLQYYHSRKEVPDDYDYPREQEMDTSLDSSSGSKNSKGNTSDEIKPVPPIPSIQPAFCELLSSEPKGDSRDLPSLNDSTESDSFPLKRKTPYTFLLSDTNSLCAGCGPFTDENATMGPLPDLPGLMEPTEGPDVPNTPLQSCQQHQCAFEACDEDSVCYQSTDLVVQNNENSLEMHQRLISSNENNNKPEPLIVLPSFSSNPSCSSSEDVSRKKKEKKEKEPSLKRKRMKKSSGSSIGSEGSFKIDLTERIHQENKSKMLKIGTDNDSSLRSQNNKKRSTKNSSLSSNIPSLNKKNPRQANSESGLFLYVDLHGHTTKRGIFMYGNHFSDAVTQAECMLLPRLMSVNFQHFDFSACNFTERLMNLRDRRDGASREGCGRVACLKLTGLVRSYTLECNYNTGRFVNHMINRPSVPGIVEPTPYQSPNPPKFTIETYEGVGTALAESILDLSGRNLWSRLVHTEFRNLDGAKRSLIRRLKYTPEYPEYKPPSQPSLDMPSKSSKAFCMSNLKHKYADADMKLSLGGSKQGAPGTGGPLGLRKENPTAPDSKEVSSRLNTKLRPVFNSNQSEASTSSRFQSTIAPKISQKSPIQQQLKVKKLCSKNMSVPCAKSKKKKLKKLNKT